MHRIFSAATLLQLKSGAKVEVLGGRNAEQVAPLIFEKKVVLLHVFLVFCRSMKMTMYEIMKALKIVGAWRFCSAIFPKFETLILYYQVYEIFQRKVSLRKRGYLVELLNDTAIQSILPKDRFNCVKWGTDDIRWAIREMEREYYV